ncbi:MAG: pre-16S rRNA-processing nuclease YqgF [Cyanobacteria bacterium P01_A01_bin.40]
MKTLTILGFDPGRDKCGVAIMNTQLITVYHQVIDSAQAIAILEQLAAQYAVDLVVIGDGTTSTAWRQQIESRLSQVPVMTVDETNSTLEARDRYWLMYPPRRWQRLVPQSLRVPPRPVDDIVAILLIERYLNQAHNARDVAQDHQQLE